MSNDAPVLNFADAGFGMGAGARTVSMMFTMIITRGRGGSG
jgi:hypothetical protein